MEQSFVGVQAPIPPESMQPPTDLTLIREPSYRAAGLSLVAGRVRTSAVVIIGLPLVLIILLSRI